ncbi:hypothetical protein [Nonomuraea maritima]|uniref:hypothetical protein n=1 Tax=Nonomuraea maritima TaxID=683260 RepID=UPI00372260B2
MAGRYVLPNPPGAAEHTLTTTGWDAHFRTFWAQSYVGDEQDVFRYGTAPGEIPTQEQLAELLRTHGVTIPPEVARGLALDHRQGSAL